MSRRSTTGTVGLAARHLRARSSTSIALAVLVGLAVAVAALLPRALSVLSDAELQQQLSRLPTSTTDLYGTGTFGVLDTVRPTSAEQVFGSTDTVLARVPDTFEQPLSRSLGAGTWMALLPPDLVTLAEPRVRVQPVLGLAVDLHWQDRVTIVDGTAPQAWSRESGEPMQIAISQDYAEQAGFAVGDVVTYFDAPLVVSAVYVPIDASDPYWVHARELQAATVIDRPSALTTVRGAAFVDPLSAAGLGVQLQRSELRAWYPLVPDGLTFADVPALSDQLRRAATLGLYLPSGEALVFETGLPNALDRVVATVSTVSAVLALAGSAPLGALLAVLSLGVRAVLERRRTTLLLALSRGASPVQARGTLLVEGVLIALPAAALGLLAAVLLIPADPGPATLVAPVLIALAVPVLLVTSPLRAGGARPDLGARGGRVRWVVELAVMGVAALALFLLLRRGLVTTAGGGVDPLLAATPLLLSLVVCVVVLRLYPLPLLLLQRAARAGSSPVGLVGATGSVRANAAAFGSVLAMVVGVSSAVFSLVLASTVTAGLATAAASETGADIRVEAPGIDPAALAGVEGVRAAAALDTVPGVEIVFGLDRPHVTVVFADTAALHDVRPDLPELAAGSILVSADIADRGLGDTALDGHAVTAVGTVPVRALPGLARQWVLADIADKEAVLGEDATWDSALIATTPVADIAATADRVGDLVTEAQRDADRTRVLVVDTADLVEDAAARPAIAGLTGALLAAAGLSLALCVLAVALGALGAAAGRARTLGVLALIGMTRRQLRGVLAWELAPVTITALVAGTAFGIGLAAAVGALVDLRSVVGGSAPIDATVPWLLVAATAAVFAAVVVGTGALTSAIARRLSASAAVRMGAE